jgi:hypothetical protein
VNFEFTMSIYAFYNQATVPLSLPQQ